MPRGKSRNATTSRDAQRTLSFNSKSAKVTKPSVADATRNGKKLDNLAPTVQKAQDVIKNDAEAISTPQVPTEDQAPLIEAKTRDDIDIKAEKIPEKALLQYWRIEEERRKARRVHQEDLSVHEKILRHFDLSTQYGPCVGISRLKRWKRANTLDLHPPIEVLAVLLKEENKSNIKSNQAYVDELVSGPRIIE